MTAVELLGFVAQGLYFLVFVVVLRRAIERPLRAAVDMTLLFGFASLSIALGWLVEAFPPLLTPAIAMLQQAVVMSLPDLLLRLVEDFSTVPLWIRRGAEVGLGLSIAGIVVTGGDVPPVMAIAMVVYFVVFEVYSAVAFARQANRTHGVTSRRMQAVAIGAYSLGALLVLVGIQLLLPTTVPVIDLVTQLAAVASGVAFFVGFAPPTFLRRAWQEPELRAFLRRAASLPRLPSTEAIVAELERGAAASLGAPGASIGLWVPSSGRLRYRTDEGELRAPPGDFIAGRVFSQQRAHFAANASREDPAHAELYERTNARAVLAAPITAGNKRLGVLSVYASRAPIFAEDDLELVQLLADQAAVVLESRELIDEAARVQAQKEATRLKDDFLSAAAHDLKTPLTTLVAQAQLMERRALRMPDAPADLAGIQRFVRETKRLNSLVLEFLDVARLEPGQLIGTLERVDLAQVAAEVCTQETSPDHRCILDAPEPVVGSFDRNRIVQLLSNLVENAVKYSPGGGDIEICVRKHDNIAELAVSDHGIGIPAEDLTSIFDRFHRGSNVDDRRFAGMGLGLYICRGIAEQHGGRIWATSRGAGKGSTIYVWLPLSPDATAVASTPRNELANA